jgi:N-acylneuraminate cytidylyltransferase
MRARRAEILAVIPVSGQDPEFKRGLPRLHGRSLLSYTFEAAKASRTIARTIVWTDDERIARAARQAKIDAPAIRPRSERALSMATVLQSAVDCIQREEPEYAPEWIVRLNVTYPYRPKGLIDQAVKTVLSQDLDSAFVAIPEFDTFWQLEDGNLPVRITTDTSVPRSQRTPIYREVGGLFSMVHRSTLARGMMYGERLGIIPVTMPVMATDLHAVWGRELAAALPVPLGVPRRNPRRGR